MSPRSSLEQTFSSPGGSRLRERRKSIGAYWSFQTNVNFPDVYSLGAASNWTYRPSYKMSQVSCQARAEFFSDLLVKSAIFRTLPLSFRKAEHHFRLLKQRSNLSLLKTLKRETQHTCRGRGRGELDGERGETGALSSCLSSLSRFQAFK